ncbi:hypothetical protein ACFVY1_32920 [Streptomyces sp. NPDC058293]|uniref:hypothetical protein n=1 Tax=Streptomyces sp. NPDC058293 TaxID=3346429 RepID=UPI0036EEFC89
MESQHEAVPRSGTATRGTARNLGLQPEEHAAVLPGTHTLPLERPELVNPLILSFLRGADPAPDWNAFTG